MVGAEGVTGEVAVAPQDDRSLRPRPKQTDAQPLEDRGDEPAALPFVDIQGLIAPV